MEAVRQTERRRDRHARRLNQDAIRGAGSPTKVGRALDVSRTAVCHWTSDRVNPALREAFGVLLRLDAHPEVSGRAFAEAVSEAVELSEVVHAADEVLVARGVYLMVEENRSCQAEDEASLIGPEAHSAALRKHGNHALELAGIIDELLFRRIDLHAEYRARAVGS